MSNQNQNQVQEATTTTAQAQLEELKAKIKKAKEEKKTRDWEAKYAHVVPGSTREDRKVSTGKHGHGKVCVIRCEMCQAERTINVQDAFQVRYCEAHADMAKKVRQQERREEKKVAKLTPEAIKAEMARLEAMLAAVSGKASEENLAELEALKDEVEAA
jgi:hypothetical protein